MARSNWLAQPGRRARGSKSVRQRMALFRCSRLCTSLFADAVGLLAVPAGRYKGQRKPASALPQCVFGSTVRLEQPGCAIAAPAEFTRPS